MSIDVAYFIVMIFAVFKGYSKGFIVGIFSFVALVIGLAAALKLSTIVAHSLESVAGMSGKWLPFIAFALVFIIVVLLVNLGARFLRKAVSMVMLGWADQLGGIILYMVLYTIIFSVFLFFASKTFLLQPETIAASRVYHFVSPWGPYVIDHLGKILPVFKGLFSQLEIFFENMGHNLSPQIQA